MGGRRIFVSFAAGLALLLAVPAASAEVDDGGRAIGDAAVFDLAALDARGGIGQIFVTDAVPGESIEVWMWTGDGAGGITVLPTAEAVVDDLGSAMFRELSGGHYLVATDSQVAWAVPVDSSDSVVHPDQSFYDAQELVEGYQYIETRDGTTLSAYVVLPGPADKGPYPTVVEYSGYDPSNPVSGLGGLVGDFDPTPFCGAIPILCKAPAQPASLLAGVFGYAVVGVNMRGTGCSGGAYDFFEQMQVLDGYDVIEAVAAQDWVLDHEVGMVGLSYPGITQLWVGQTRPPGLAAITPLSVYGDTATGVLAPGGLLNTGFATAWADNVLGNAEPFGPAWVNELIDAGDTECAQNQKLRLQNVDATAKAQANPFYTEEVAAPLDPRRFVGEIDVPVFLGSAFQDEQTGPSFGEILGEFDASPSVHQIVYNGLHADGFAPQILSEWAAFLDIYVAKEVPSVDPLVTVLAALFTEGIFGGAVDMPPDRWSGVTTHEQARAIWESEPSIQILFESGAGAEAGLPVAAWSLAADQWPPEGVTAHRLWLGASGSLAEEPLRGPSRGAAIHPDPAVSQTSFRGDGNIWDKNPDFDWVPQGAGGAAVFETAPLAEDVVLAGTASVDLWIRSDADEAELEAVLSEVRPDGQEMRVQAGQLQASYRALHPTSTELNPVQYGYEADWAPLEPGVWTSMRIKIPAFAHAFRAGSAIRLTVNTPGGDTAQWEFELDGPGAEATHLIGTGPVYRSSIALPVIDGLDAPTELPPCPSLRGQPCRPTPPIENEIVRGGRAGGPPG